MQVKAEALALFFIQWIITSDCVQVLLGSLELWQGQTEADADPKDGSRIEHVGMYIGTAQNRQHRLISSRKSLNGTTCRDNEKGKSDLDKGIYERTFQAVRRL